MTATRGWYRAGMRTRATRPYAGSRGRAQEFAAFCGAGQRSRPARGSGEALGGTVSWQLFSLACVFYAVPAFDYFLRLTAGRTGLGLLLFATLRSREFALGAGSVDVDQQLPYGHGRVRGCYE